MYTCKERETHMSLFMSCFLFCGIRKSNNVQKKLVVKVSFDFSRFSFFQSKLHAFVHIDEGFAAWAAMLYILAGVHTERNQTTRPDPGQKTEELVLISLIYYSWLVVHSIQQATSYPQKYILNISYTAASQ